MSNRQPHAGTLNADTPAALGQPNQSTSIKVKDGGQFKMEDKMED